MYFLPLTTREGFLCLNLSQDGNWKHYGIFFFFFGNYSWEMALLKELVLMVFSVQFSELTLEIWIKLQILDVYFIKI